jgi:hypothetical protein
MKPNKWIVLWMLFSGVMVLHAQSVDQIKADRDTYIWGEGSGNTLKAADQQALADIISQISTYVQNDFTSIKQESGDKFKETVNDVLKTYSSATLNNTVRLTLQNEPDAKVFRYIKRSEIDKVFEARKNKIIEFAKNGEQALKGLQIADALRYFYWSQTLLRSHKDAGEIKMRTADFNEVLLITWLPLTINSIFNNLKFYLDASENKNTYTEVLLDIRYNNNPVRNLDYTYWTGQDWTNIISAKDGVGVAELPVTGSTMDLRLKVEYSFEGESAIDMELRDVMDKLPLVPYKNAYVQIQKKPETGGVAVSGGSSATNNQTNSGAVSAVTGVSSTNTTVAPGPTENAATGELNKAQITPLNEATAYESIMKQIIQALQTKTYDKVNALFTTEGYDIFINLLKYGNAKVLKIPELKYFSCGDMIFCRSVPMSFSFQNNKRTFVEDVVFTFGKDKKINNISFGLSKQSVDDIVSRNSWPDNTKLMLINFMENYKTAYALKRIDYIKSIFSDDALIITGSVLKVNPNPEFRYMNNEKVKYTRQSKQQYMRNLEMCFKSNEFINIRFADNNVRQSGKGNDVYGIQIKQDYFSSNYGDTGYLFLLIDMTDSIKPVIHVRTWQPQKNPDGSIVGISDF